MTDSFELNFKGLKEVEERLILLGGVGGEKVMRSVMRAAARPFLTHAKTNLAFIRGSGALHKATRIVYMRSATRSGGGGTRFTVAVAPKVKDKVASALASLHYGRRIRGVFWGHLLEWGHRIGTRRTGRLTRSKGLRRTRLHAGLGRVEGQKPFTRALQSGVGEAIEIFRRQIRVKVERALAKQNLT